MAQFAAKVAAGEQRSPSSSIPAVAVALIVIVVVWHVSVGGIGRALLAVDRGNGPVADADAEGEFATFEHRAVVLADFVAEGVLQRCGDLARNDGERLGFVTPPWLEQNDFGTVAAAVGAIAEGLAAEAGGDVADDDAAARRGGRGIGDETAPGFNRNEVAAPDIGDDALLLEVNAIADDAAARKA